MFAKEYAADPAQSFVHINYAVLLSRIDTKLMHLAFDNREPGCKHIYFSEAPISSGL